MNDGLFPDRRFAAMSVFQCDCLDCMGKIVHASPCPSCGVEFYTQDENDSERLVCVQCKISIPKSDLDFSLYDIRVDILTTGDYELSTCGINRQEEIPKKPSRLMRLLYIIFLKEYTLSSYAIIIYSIILAIMNLSFGYLLATTYFTELIP